MPTTSRRTTTGLWVVLVFLFGVVAAGMWFGRDDPNTPWGPIILGAFGLMAMVVRALFKISDPSEGDGYERF